MAGNRLGARGKYGYVSDIGEDYAIVTDASLATAAGLAAPVPGAPRKPVRFEPRGVYAESVASPKARRFLVCDTPTNTLYNSNAPQTVQIDGEDFITTGRRGENVSL